MLQAKQLPACISKLDSRLSNMNRQDFTHFFKKNNNFRYKRQNTELVREEFTCALSSFNLLFQQHAARETEHPIPGNLVQSFFNTLPSAPSPSSPLACPIQTNKQTTTISRRHPLLLFFLFLNYFFKRLFHRTFSPSPPTPLSPRKSNSH